MYLNKSVKTLNSTKLKQDEYVNQFNQHDSTIMRFLCVLVIHGIRLLMNFSIKTQSPSL